MLPQLEVCGWDDEPSEKPQKSNTRRPTSRRRRVVFADQAEVIVSAKRKKKKHHLKDDDEHDVAGGEVHALRREVKRLSKKVLAKRDEDDDNKLKWRDDIEEWLGDDGKGEIAIDSLAAELTSAVVNGIDDPSLYALVSARESFITAEPDDGLGKLIPQGINKYRPTPIMVAVLLIFVMLTFLTIILPLCLLANFYRRVPFFYFRYDSEIPDPDIKQRHIFFLRCTSAFLLFYLLYTSLRVLDEIRIFRFFLLGLPDEMPSLGDDDAETNEKEDEDEEAPKGDNKGRSSDTSATLSDQEDDEDDLPARGQQRKKDGPAKSIDQAGKELLRGGFKMTRGLVKLGENAVFAQSPLIKPFLILGMTSKLVSVICVFQLTFVIFRLEPDALSMILNSVALAFLLDADQALVKALGSSQSLRRWYARAVVQLRHEAQKIVDTPRMVPTMVEPMTYNFPEVAKQSVNNNVADHLAKRFPYMFSWLVMVPGAVSHASQIYLDGVEDEEEKKQQILLHRRCCRSEVLHRCITHFVYFYGGLIIFLQIAGSIVCGFKGTCGTLNKYQGFDDDHVTK